MSLAAMLFFSPATWAANADVILYGGRVFTSEPSALWAEAVAIRGRHVVAVGRSAEVLRLAGRGTRLVNLGGRLVVPGFNDAHVHSQSFDGPLVSPPDFAPGPGPTRDEVLGRLAGAAQQVPEGTWLYGFVGEAVMDDPAMSRFVLDAVTPRHPVLLIAWQGPHQVFANTAALAAAGIPENAPDPAWGWYRRIPGTDVLDGALFEYAGMGLVIRRTEAVPLESARASYARFAAESSALGITSLQDMSNARTPEILDGLSLPIRIRNICVPLQPEDRCPPVGPSHPGSRITWSGRKLVLDGTPVERNAALSAPYTDSPSWSGVLNLSREALEAELRQALTLPPADGQRITHAIGDAAIDTYLDALEAAAPARVWRQLRPRLEHADLMTPAQIQRARRLGVVVVQNPTHFGLAAVFQARVGPERTARASPFKSLLRAGIPVAIGSDGSARPTNPFVDLMMAVVHPLNPAEGLSLEEAVIAHTRGAAYAEFEEHRKGTLTPGKLADLAVLSQDIFQVPLDALPATHSVLTMVGGEVVHTTGELVVP